MRTISGFVLGVVTTVVLSACGSDEGTGGKGTGGSSASGNSSTGGVGTGTGGAGTSTGGSNNNGNATGGSKATGGSGTTTGGKSAGTGGTGAGASNVCDSACQKLVSANCGDYTAADCAECATPGTACVSELDAFYGCISSKGVVSCQSAETVVAGCNAENTAVGVCAVCLPQTGDSACATCTRSSCCDEVKAYVSTADVDGYNTCVTPCMDQACVDACAKMYPLAGKADAAINTCQGKSCVDDCVCGASANDTTCISCVKTTCCADFAKYVTASDVGPFGDCLDACADTDTACVEACISQFPVAGPAYESLITGCVSNECASSCGG